MVLFTCWCLVDADEAFCFHCDSLVDASDGLITSPFSDVWSS